MRGHGVAFQRLHARVKADLRGLWYREESTDATGLSQVCDSCCISVTETDDRKERSDLWKLLNHVSVLAIKGTRSL